MAGRRTRGEGCECGRDGVMAEPDGVVGIVDDFDVAFMILDTRNP